MVNVPVKVPLAVGLNTIAVVQLAPAASVVPHPNDEIANGAVMPAPLTVIAELVPLVRTTFCGELVLPSACDPKFRLVGETATPPVADDPPVPVSAAD